MKYPTKCLIALSLLSSTACSFIPTTSPTSMPKNSIIQSEIDNRQYQAFTLDNQLEVLIISDPDEEKAAASLDVFVGSASDPQDRAGLAHFLEHMLFLGTDKFPDPDEYQTFIAQHGGSRNAYTAKEHTNYFFDIETSALEPMLDRFSQFFIAPLFNPEFVEREKNAVHSEYLGKIKTDSRRYHAAMQQAFNPKSLYAKFSVGNLNTLADRDNQNVRDDLLAFYQSHYSANKMRLVVLANQPLPLLKKWVTEKFSAIPNTHAQKAVFNSPLLTAKESGQWINIESLQDKRELALLFTLPETQSHYLAKPSAYFQSLLGHEGEGSILALLKEKGWADELSVSTGFSNDAQESSLYLGINLTQSGLKHQDDVLDIVFQYIRLLQKEGAQAWLYQEQQQMADLRFRYQAKRNASHTVTELSRQLHYYPAQDVLRGGIIMEQFKPKLIHDFLQQLTPERVLISLNAQQLKTDKVEEYYHVDYGIYPLSNTQIERWAHSAINPALSLAKPNPFIPSELALKTQTHSLSHPKLIQKTTNLDVWHQLDTHFKTPKNSLYLALHTPDANQSPKVGLLASLLSGTLEKQLNSYAYPAKLAGLDYAIYPTERGLTIHISGYAQKQTTLLKQILSALKQPEITEERFAILKDRFDQELNNAKQQQPFQQVLAELKRSLVERHWTNQQKLDALHTLTRNDLVVFSQTLLDKLQLTLLMQGNTDETETKQTVQLIQQQLPTPQDTITVPKAKVIQLPEQSIHARRLEIDNQDAALALYFQAKDNSIHSRAAYHLLGSLLSPAFFADLRTRQQLGYNIGAAALPIKDVPALVFILQSSVISAVEIEQRIQTFINDFEQQLTAMPLAEFEQYKSGLITRLLEKDKNLQKSSYRHWLEIDRQNYDFNSKQQIADVVKTINKVELLAIYSGSLLNHPRKFRSYSLGTKFTQQDFSQENLIRNPELFKKNSAKYPSHYQEK